MSALKRNDLLSHEKTGRKFKCILLKSKKPIRKSYILYDSNTLEKAGVKVEERRDEWSTGNF